MTAPMQATHGASARLDRFWKAVQVRLTTAETTTLLAGGRVYIGTEDFSRPAGDLTAAWGRQVIVPTATLWPGAEMDPSWRGAGWLVRSEINHFAGVGYDPGIPLERLQQIAFEQLAGWIPTATGLIARLAVYRQRAPQGMPELDVDRDVWWMSSEYRCEVSRL